MADSGKTPGLFSAGKAESLKYIYVGSKEKLSILAHWLLGRRYGVSPGDMAKYLFRKPLVARGRELVQKLEVEGDFYILYLRGVDSPVYYPKDYELPTLYINACSCFFPDDWHYYEVPETRVAPDDIVLDCGAAEGIFSVMAAGRCKRVYAVEPLPHFIIALEKTCLRLNNVEILPVALSDRVGEVSIVDAGFASSIDIPGEGTSSYVKATTIDNLFFEKGVPVDFIKADLEGHELLMLKGAENTLRENSPRIAITTYHRREHADLISQYLRSVDHRYNFRTKGICRFGTPFMLHAWVE